MRIQAWGWLATALLAAALNSSYHNGGLEWAHRIAGQVEHNTNAVLALATGRADQFLAEAQIISAHPTASCPLSAVLAKVQRSVAASRTNVDRFEAMSDREQAQFDRLEANRARLEARLSRLRVATFNPVEIHMQRIVCPRVRVNLPRIPHIKVPSVPVVNVEYTGPGPV